MKRWFQLYLLFILFALSGFSQNQNSRITVSPIPDWIQKIEPEYDVTEEETQSSSFVFLLSHQQYNLLNKQYFNRSVVQIISAEGLREISNPEVDFDPSYQKLIVHNIQVVRDGKVINKLDLQAVQMIQREVNIERHIYDGRLTAIMNLSDIRVGDIIDYCYSITGYNPVFAGHYSKTIYLQYSLPIRRLYVQIDFPAEKDLHFKCNNGASQPLIHESSNKKTFIWDQKKVPSLLLDINTPEWYDPYSSVSLSDFSSWGEVVDWYLPMFSLDQTGQEKLLESVREVIGNFPADSILLPSIRFAQDKIRYLGFVNGLNSYQPHSPVQVLNQRYGDCKDKSFFLSALLNSAGIEAAPVLVHSYNGPVLKDDLPSPAAFDHCVVQFIKDGIVYYVDPTISNQGGDLDHNYIPNYYSGLVIKSRERDLIDLPVSDYSKVKMTEIFNLGEVGTGAELNVISVYSGAEADYQRQYFASLNLEQIQKDYIDFYSKLYPRIKSLRPLEVVDQRNEINEFTVNEFYAIDSLWSEDVDHKDIIYCEFCPLVMQKYMVASESPRRSMPYKIAFPVNFRHEIFIKLPEKWNIKNEVKNIEYPFFSYLFSVNYDKDIISIVHHYQTFRPFIAADSAEVYIREHNNITESLTYMLTYNRSLADSEFRFSELIGVIAFITLLISTTLAVVVYYNYDLPVTEYPEKELQIDGWLILVAIGITVTPFRVLYGILSTPEFFNYHVWDGLLNKNLLTPDWQSGAQMFAELIYNIVYLVYSVLVAVLFYRRRTIFPRCAILMYLIVPLVSILDSLLAFRINPDLYSDIEKQEAVSEIGQALLVSAIRVPYFLLSKRVKKTFVKVSPRNRDKKVPAVKTETEKNSFKPAWYLSRPVMLTGVIIILLLLVMVIWNHKEDQSEVRFSLPGLEENESPFSPAEGPQKSLPKVDHQKDWNYVILQCMTRQDADVQLRIITVDDYARAESILVKLNRGISFKELASQESSHPSRSAEGYLGKFKLSDLSIQFQEALNELKEGEYTGIISISEN